jgi:hypothetical protein
VTAMLPTGVFAKVTREKHNLLFMMTETKF